MDDAGVEVLARELVARNLDDCPRVITDPDQVEAGRTMYLRKTSAAVTPFWPGPMQLRQVVPPDRDHVVVSFELAPRGSDDPVAASVLVKRGDAPIAFTYTLAARDTNGDPSGASEKVRELTLVEGDWDLELPATRIAGPLHEVVVGGLHPGEVVHVALAVTQPVDAVASEVRVLGGAADEETATGDDEEPADGEREQVLGEDPSSSCACGTATGDGGLLGLVLPLVRRRRGRR